MQNKGLKMSDFTLRTIEEVMHNGDGWSYVIKEHDDGLIQIQYKDQDSEKMSIDSIWPESARKIAASLIRIANQIEPQLETTKQNSLDYQKGFYAGVAYASYGEEVIDAAKSL